MVTIMILYDLTLVTRHAGRTAPPATKAKPEPRKSLTPLEANIILARRGNKKVLPRLRRWFDGIPNWWPHFGNLTLQVQGELAPACCRKRPLAGRDYAAAPRRDAEGVAGAQPEPLDRLLVDRILACHVEVLYFEAMETTDPTAENMRVARYRMDRGAQAHDSFVAVKMLATVRNLVPAHERHPGRTAPSADGTGPRHADHARHERHEKASRAGASLQRRQPVRRADWQASWNQWASARAERGRQTEAHQPTAKPR